MKKVCMVVQNPMVKGGIAAVVNGYRGSRLEKDFDITYVESYKDGGKISKLLKAIKGYFHFFCVLLFQHPDLIHMHSSFGPSFYRSLLFIYLSSWFRCPLINHIHGADFDEFYVNAGLKKKERVKKAYGKCSVLIALSQEWKDKLSQIVPASKIKIVENYSILHEDALTKRFERKCNEEVLFLGELGQRKGCYDIPSVVEKVRAEIPEARFVLGGSGSEEKQIKSLFNCNVEFPGWVRGKDKDRLLREADVFFLPSYNEGMPMSVLDAMGYGLPIVSTNVGGIPKIVKENGVCCEPGDVSSMSTAIIELLRDGQKREAAGRASVSIVKAGYSLEVHLERLEEIYESVGR